MSKLLDSISQLRDIFTSGDYDLIEKNMYKIEKTYLEVARWVRKKEKSKEYFELDFATQDLVELLDECKPVLDHFRNLLDYHSLTKEYEAIEQPEEYKKVFQKQMSYTYCVRHLQEFWSVITYCAIHLHLLEQFDENADIGSVLKNALMKLMEI